MKIFVHKKHIKISRTGKFSPHYIQITSMSFTDGPVVSLNDSSLNISVFLNGNALSFNLTLLTVFQVVENLNFHEIDYRENFSLKAFTVAAFPNILFLFSLYAIKPANFIKRDLPIPCNRVYGIWICCIHFNCQQCSIWTFLIFGNSIILFLHFEVDGLNLFCQITVFFILLKHRV